MASKVWPLMMPAIKGASPPSWRARMYEEVAVGSAAISMAT